MWQGMGSLMEGVKHISSSGDEKYRRGELGGGGSGGDYGYLSSDESGGWRN